MKMPVYTPKEIVLFTEEEIRAIQKSVEHTKQINDGKWQPYQYKRPTPVRDRALLMLLLDTGLRSGECARLMITDFNLENR